MKEFLEFILHRLVENPDEVIVTQGEDGSVIFFKISLNPDDVGRVVGKNGQTIQSIRNLMEASTLRHNKKIAIEILRENEF